MDIFISYRRDCGSVMSHAIQQMLTKDGFTVFWDQQALSRHTGCFDDAVRNAILSAEYFLLVLNADALNDLDKHIIFRQEIELALSANKRIIPVCADSFQFPEHIGKCGAGFEQLPRLQAIIVKQLDEQFHLSVLGMMTELPLAVRLYAQSMFRTYLEPRSAVERRLPLEDRLSGDVIAVDSVSLSGQTMLSVERRIIEQLLRNGCRFRIVICDPACPAADEAIRYRIDTGTERQRRRMLCNSRDDMADWIDAAPEQFSGRLFSLSMLCSILIVRHADREKDMIRVGFYGFGEKQPELRRADIKRADADNFAYYEQQFEWIWEHAAPISGTNSDKNKE